MADKWFSMRTDFFGIDAHVLGFYKLSPAAMGLYVASIAYASRQGIEYAFRDHARWVGITRPSAVVSELVEHGFWIKIPDEPKRFGIAHEGTLWRRGTPLQRRAIPKSVRATVMERDGYECVLCGNADELTLDHIWPYSKGGLDTVENLRVLCRSCNSSKGARIDAA